MGFCFAVDDGLDVDVDVDGDVDVDVDVDDWCILL